MRKRHKRERERERERNNHQSVNSEPAKSFAIFRFGNDQNVQRAACGMLLFGRVWRLAGQIASQESANRREPEFSERFCSEWLAVHRFSGVTVGRNKIRLSVATQAITLEIRGILSLRVLFFPSFSRFDVPMTYRFCSLEPTGRRRLSRLASICESTKRRLTIDDRRPTHQPPTTTTATMENDTARTPTAEEIAKVSVPTTLVDDDKNSNINSSSNNGMEDSQEALNTLPSSPNSVRLELTEQERQVFQVFTETAKAFELGNVTVPNKPCRAITIRVAGGWVRDKILGKDTHDVDVTIDHLTGVEYATLVQDHLRLLLEQQHHHH